MFGLFRKRKAEGAPAPPLPPLGWEAIERAFAQLYPEQKAKHWAHGGVRRMHDLDTPPQNPLEGVSVYDASSFWHYVSFGLSDLYEKTSPSEASGLGFAFTFRLAKGQRPEQPPLWPIDVMVSLARAAFSGSTFGEGHTMKTGPLDGKKESKLTALLLVRDPGFDVQQTPHGCLTFLQLVGVQGESRERALRIGVQQVVDELRNEDANLVTRLA
jgi:hypothetical protein